MTTYLRNMAIGNRSYPADGRWHLAHDQWLPADSHWYTTHGYWYPINSHGTWPIAIKLGR
jgi:hypothetical protein